MDLFSKVVDPQFGPVFGASGSISSRAFFYVEDYTRLRPLIQACKVQRERFEQLMETYRKVPRNLQRKYQEIVEADFWPVVGDGRWTEVIAFLQALYRLCEKIGSPLPGQAPISIRNELPPDVPSITFEGNLYERTANGGQGTIYRNLQKNEVIKVFDKVPGIQNRHLEKLVELTRVLRASGLPVVEMRRVVSVEFGGKMVPAVIENREIGASLEEVYKQLLLRNQAEKAYRFQDQAEAVLDFIDEKTGGLADRHGLLSMGLREDLSNFLYVGNDRFVNVDPIDLVKLMEQMEREERTAADSNSVSVTPENKARREKYDAMAGGFAKNGLVPERIANQREEGFAQSNDGQWLPKKLPGTYDYSVLIGWPLSNERIRETLANCARRVTAQVNGDVFPIPAGEIHCTLFCPIKPDRRVSVVPPGSDAFASLAIRDVLTRNGPLTFKNPRLIITEGGVVMVGWEVEGNFDAVRAELHERFKRIYGEADNFPTIVAHMTLARIINPSKRDLSEEGKAHLLDALSDVNADLSRMNLSFTVDEVTYRRSATWGGDENGEIFDFKYDTLKRVREVLNLSDEGEQSRALIELFGEHVDFSRAMDYFVQMWVASTWTGVTITPERRSSFMSQALGVINRRENREAFLAMFKLLADYQRGIGPILNVNPTPSATESKTQMRTEDLKKEKLKVAPNLDGFPKRDFAVLVRFLIDSILEARYFVTWIPGGLLSIIEAWYLGDAYSIHLLIASSILLALGSDLGLSPYMKKLFIRAHRGQAYHLTNLIRRLNGATRLRARGYHREIEKVYSMANRSALRWYIRTALLLCFFDPNLPGPLIIVVAAMVAIAANIIRHLWISIQFWLGRFDRAPVPGSSGATYAVHRRGVDLIVAEERRRLAAA
jgi:hypothetical protein